MRFQFETANQAYSNVVDEADSPVVWLQYWMFYYHNPPINAANTDFGEHEGDWEFVQIAYDMTSNRPLLASYNQHNGAETCAWDGVSLALPSGRPAPVVFVARNSHASYFSRGTYNLEVVAGEFGDDIALGEEGTELTLHGLMDTPWQSWQGTWGDTQADDSWPLGEVEASSPHGPGHGPNEEELTDPMRVAEGGRACRKARATATALEGS